jgi:archaeosortase A (PGF-CTERM-specific)
MELLLSSTDALAWVVIALFVGGSVGRYRSRTTAQYVTTLAWVTFAVFWLALFPHFLLEKKSAIEGVLSLVAVPASLYTGYLVLDGRDSLLRLSTAIGIMGLFYYPGQNVPLIREFLIETTAQQTLWALHALGFDVSLTTGPVYGYTNEFDWATPTQYGSFSTYIVYACTGIGSISIFAGLTLTADAPLGRRLRTFALAAGVIWLLNLVRNVFIAAASSLHWFNYGPLVTLAGIAGVDSNAASYFVSDSIISQSLSVVALVGLTYVILQRLPEVIDILEEVLYVLTGSEWDLQEVV